MLVASKIMEMIDGEPPYFNEQPLTAMRKIRDQPPPKLKNPHKVGNRLVLRYLTDRACSPGVIDSPRLSRSMSRPRSLATSHSYRPARSSLSSPCWQSFVSSNLAHTAKHRQSSTSYVLISSLKVHLIIPLNNVDSKSVFVH